MTKFKYILLDYVDKKNNNFKIHEIDIDSEWTVDMFLDKFNFDLLEFQIIDATYNKDTKKLNFNIDYENHNIRMVIIADRSQKMKYFIDEKPTFFEAIYPFIKTPPPTRGYGTKNTQDWSFSSESDSELEEY